jgi:hypothetical protein
MTRRNFLLSTAFVLFFLGLVAGVANGDIQTGLVAHWTFDEGQGTTAGDSSGNAVDGTLQNDPQWVAGHLQGALQFDGVDDYVRAPHIPFDNQTFTIAMWINPVLYRDQIVVFSQTQTSSTNLDMHFRLGGPGGTGPNPGFVRMGFYSNDLDTAAAFIEDNNWYHLTFWYDFENGDRRIFVNGVQAAQAASTPYLGASGDTLIGSWWGSDQFFRGIIDDVRVYHRALTPEDVLELYNWVGGANAGKDFRVYGGDRVSLAGIGPSDATSVTWQQVAGTPTVTLENTADPYVKEFDAPELEIGTLLTFRLTVDAPSTQGVTSDDVDVIITAINAPKVAPGPVRIMPLDLTATGFKLGFRLEWPPLIDAEEYEVGLMLSGVWMLTLGSYPGTFYESTGMNVGDTRTLGIRGVNKHGTAAEDATAVVGPYEAMRNMARAAGPTPPSDYVYVVSTGTIGGMNDGNYAVSNDSSDGVYKEEDYWGYLWGSDLFFDHIAYYTGEMFGDGGWFLDMKVQYTQDGTTWADAPIVKIEPAYDFTDQRTGKRRYTRYDITMPTLRGTGIRIAGTPGGMATFTSISELEVFGLQTQGPLIVQGIDATYPEGGTAYLDASLTFSTGGPITSYQWTGPGGVTIANPTSAMASFQAPYVSQDTVYVFSLQAGDGTNTGTDADVRILVKNLMTTAVAGEDRWVMEGSEVALDGRGSLTTTANIAYLWTQTAGTNVGVTGAATATAQFTAPAIWDYTEDLTFELQVNDGAGGVSTDDVLIEVRNALSAEVYDLEAGAFTHILHLGQTPMDRIFISQESEIDSDYLAAFGGEAAVNPKEGDAYDFTGTGVPTTRPVLVWTLEHATDAGTMDNAFGDIQGLEYFMMYWHIYILSPDERQARLHFANDDPVRGWNNGQRILAAPCCNSDPLGTVDFTLHKGLNSMMFKLVEVGGGNYFGAGITDLSDVYYADLKYSLGPSLILTDAYASRSLPTSYGPGDTVDVDLAMKVNPASTPTSVIVSETIPAGIPQANVSAPGATVGAGKITWNLTTPNVKQQTLSYSLTVPSEGMTDVMQFAGTLTFGTTVADVFGENAVYPFPTAPRSVEVAMFQDAVVSWSAPLTPGVSSYSVFRSVNGGAWELLATTAGTSYVDSSVVAGENYSYQVLATNGVGDEGPTSRPTPQATPLTQAEVEQGREIREAEDFNYDSGQFPGYQNCPAASESPAATDLDPQYDYFHPNIGGPAPPIYRTNDPIPNGIGIETVLDDGTTDVYHTNIGWIDVTSWWRYTFNVTQAGWVDIALRVAAPSPSTMAVYWDEVLIGRTHSFSTGSWHRLIYVQLEDRIEATTGEHVVRVESVAGGMNFDKIAIAWNAAPPKRQTIWGDNFDSYTATADVFSPTVGKWTRGVTGNNEASWMLWDTEEPNLGSVAPADIAGMEDKYMVSDSDLEQFVPTDEEMLSPEVDCAGWTKLRLNFNKNYRIYPLELDPDRTQDAEVDIRSFDPASGWSNWTNLLHLDMSDVDVNADPPELSDPEVFDLSAYDGNKIQLRFHFFHAQYDFWFAVDQIRVSGVQEAVEIPLPDIALAAGNVTISWTTFGAGQYSVEYTSNLKGTWTKIAGPFAQTSFTEAMPADKTGYYRILGQ